MKEKTYNTRKGVWVGEIENGVEKKREVEHVRMNCIEEGINKYTNGGAHHFPQMDAYFMLG